ncbi:MAG TPA: hypothetical protein PLD25_19395 [Chloroflexota bacterium]|nr:hypothetical protein [Chloroflexota bacterium]HUM72092.1 hypothetical protein [Chloroflexota bacterium]
MTEKLLVQGVVPTGATSVAGGEVRRGMSVLAEDGVPVGVVAAVVCHDRAHTITHILLGQTPPTAVYRLVPLALLARLDGDCLWLRVSTAQIAALPIHQPEDIA